MQIDRERTRQLLKDFEFESLLVDLGWDRHKGEVKTEIREAGADESEYLLTAIAEKRGLAVFLCSPTPDGMIPDSQIRRKIQQEVAKSVHEHIIIYADAEKTTQIWQWVKREPGKPLARREQPYRREQSGEALIQKLETIAFSLEEEADLTLLDVTGRVRAAFDVERVTKRFYDHFKTEHARFLKFLKGIPNQEMERWYVSVMLNRLMFIYFIQKKDFLNGDPNYLQTKLEESQRRGNDRYYTDFLCPLFFEGFAKPESERSSEMGQLLGEVPYLNGGIFQRHQIEKSHGETIQIPDAAFKGPFDFFDKYQWHLDERPLRNDNEINPDVLGYIFEKYINQKQMGAYYTKEDITEYISKNTVIPFLFDAARKECRIAFEGEASVWQLLRDDLDRYIYDAVKTGVELDLPEDIVEGIGDISKRGVWNTPAPDEYANPTEIWREVVARWSRYESIHTKLLNGEIDDINALIAHNLDLRQFAQDVIENCEGPELLRAFWKAITEVTVLDPTCGSGAFLFAALNILEPLYEACLDRMEVFLAELEHTHANPRTERFRDFRKVLEDIDQHPNRRYFILKSIIINNLYGVDIMEEAIEICKLRLFLKMVAQIDDVRQIEPLPDIDFNIQTGNTLVGYATYDEVKQAVTGKFDFDNTMQRIEEKAEDVEQLFNLFRQQQTELGGVVEPDDKQVLQDKLKALEDELNRYLADEYKGVPNKKRAYQKWLSLHKPFHWFTEFYKILKAGGFDVIIGNPPYVEYSKVKKDYTIKGYKTESCGNLYAFVMERSMILGKKYGRCGMIVPLSGHSTDRMKPLITNFYSKAKLLYIMNISGDAHPSVLFPGVNFRLAIFLASTHSQNKGLHATKHSKWFTEEREGLFQLLEYVPVNRKSQNFIPKLSTSTHRGIIEKLLKHKGSLALHRGKHKIYYHNAPVHWIRAHSFVPYFHSERDGEKISTQLKPMTFERKDHALTATGVICSSLFYLWWITNSDCYHLNKREVGEFPIDLSNQDLAPKVAPIAERLMADIKEKSRRRVYVYKTSGRVEYDEFYLKESKSIIDEIDHVLAQHYGLTDEELDFIINYDIKYRLGLGN
ncbi:SAM-dependent methyltransferase [Candidatus Poribacteria bacterium]|nr:MAG: SAM-dependent methyltransferase [Candidatus Poribacteria bacterium]